MKKVLEPNEVEQIIALLKAEGRTVVGPTLRDGTIVPDEIESANDLPVGWADNQEAGRYEVVETNTSEWFASSSSSDSWKRFLTPPETLLIRSKRTKEGLTIEAPEHAEDKLAFIGIRSCDLAALVALDRVFLAPGRIDPAYEARRRNLFIVAAACAHPGNTCFCVSMNTGPSPTSGFDLSITELWDNDRHEFVVTTGSEAGEKLLSELPGRAATQADQAAESTQHDNAVAAMGRHLDPMSPFRAAANLEDPQWDELGERCLACGNCTMVCPTCFCNKTTDRTNLSGSETERVRVWDSCFSADFTSLHGTPVRAETGHRYRHWLLHKLVTWHDQFDMSGCVGCGRCISACPVGIDLTVEIQEIGS